MLKRWILTIGVLSAWLLCRGQQNASFRHYSAEDGLSENNVSCIFQDSRDYIYIGTFNGLNRFDGHTFKQHKTITAPEGKNGLENDRIVTVCEDRNRFLWITTHDRQAYRFDTDEEIFSPVLKVCDKQDSVYIDRVYPLRSGNLVMTTRDHGCLLIRPASEGFGFTSHRIVLADGSSLGDVSQVYEDKSGYGWIIADNGVFRITRNGVKIIRYHLTDKEHMPVKPTALIDTDDGYVFGDSVGDLYLADRTLRRIRQVKTPPRNPIRQLEILDDRRMVAMAEGEGFLIYFTSDNTFTVKNAFCEPLLRDSPLLTFYKDSHGEIWTGTTTTGVLHYDPVRDAIRKLRLPMDNVGTRAPVAAFFEDNNGYMWVRQTGGGFCYYDRADGSLQYFHNAPDDPQRFFTNIARRFHSDRQGNLWLVTQSKGVYKISFNTTEFNLHQPTPTMNALSENDPGSIMEDRNGNYWIATKDGQITVTDRSFRPLGILSEDGSLNGPVPLEEVVYSMIETPEGDIWLGTRYNGLIRLRSVGDDKNYRYELTRYENDPEDPFSLSNNAVFSLARDHRGRIWAGTWDGGVNCLEEEDGHIRFVSPSNLFACHALARYKRVRAIVTMPDGDLMLGTSEGLVRVHAGFDRLTQFEISTYPELLSSRNVQCLGLHSSGDIFVGTMGGGVGRVSFEGGTPRCRNLNSRNGFPSDIVLCASEDRHGHMWFASSGGLIRFYPDDNTYEHFENEQMRSLDFNAGVSLSGSDGRMIFGCDDGLVHFDPFGIFKSQHNPPLYFQSLFIYDKEIKPCEKGILTRNIDRTERIVLPHDKKVVSIGFTALDFKNPEIVAYEYLLEGFDDRWNRTGKDRRAYYTNLSSGKYLLRVRSSNSDGIWANNERQLIVHVLPPLTRTAAAYFFYVLLLLASGYYIYRFLKMRNRMRQEKQLVEMRLKFFTEISHEIRTPLSLIHTPVGYLLDHERFSPRIESQLRTIFDNSERLLKLVNQLLDFRKAQDRKLQLEQDHFSLKALVEQVAANFSAAASSENIRMKTIMNEDIHVWADRDKLETILYNLLSNAFKFSSEGKTIEVSLQESGTHIFLVIRDQGEGIASEAMKNLFMPYYSFRNKNVIQPGTGIGLALTKELCDLMNIGIDVSSVQGSGTEFRLRIPKAYGTEAGGEWNWSIHDQEQLIPDQSSERPAASHPVLLVIDDNNELLDYIAGTLSPFFDVRVARDGNEGLEIARNMIPDVILTDWLMPNLNGGDMIQNLRRDIRTSHIPVLVMTANYGRGNENDAYEAGADGFLSKPFSISHLLLRIRNIIRQRERLQARFRISVGESEEWRIKAESLPAKENELFGKINAYIESNLSDPDLSITGLCGVTCVSHSLLYKKIKNLTRLTVSEYIRDYRIKKAVELIAHGETCVQEIAYRTGFGDPGYFSRCFRKKYSVSPKEYIRHLRGAAGIPSDVPV